jgi:hypothetical protein
MIRRLSGLTGAAVMSVGLTAFVTWPQAALLSSHLSAHHDAYFSIWRLGWIAHAIATSPLRLFDANIFHPTAGTLAYSDATLLEGIVGAPLFWSGVPPVLVYNLLLLGGFAGSGVAMFVLARHVTGSTGPAMVAAAVFTMLPYRIEHFMHLELQWAMFIPLTWWALHRGVETASWRWGALAGLFLWLQMLACVYYGVFLAMTLLVFAPLVLVTERRLSTRTLVPIVAAAAVAALLTFPVALPYRAAARELGGRTIAEITRYSAQPLNYLAATSSSRLWGWTADRWGGSELRLFPGAVALVLAAVALFRRPVRPVVVYAITAVAAVELSFGLNGMTYPAVFQQIDALQGFRATARFGVIASGALAMLAGLGAQVLRGKVAQHRTRLAVVPVIFGLMMIDDANRPMGLTPGDPVEAPDAYKVIRGAPRGAVLELPVPELEHLPGWDPFYQAWSLWHWKPLVNGYSGYYPPDYLLTVLRMDVFPEDGTLDRLRAHEVRYVIVHRAFYDQDQYARLMLRVARRPELKPWGAYKDAVGTADIFELVPVD